MQKRTHLIQNGIARYMRIILLLLISKFSFAQFLDTNPEMDFPKIREQNNTITLFDRDTFGLKGEVKNVTVYNGEFKYQSYEFDRVGRLRKKTNFAPNYPNGIKDSMVYVYNELEISKWFYGGWIKDGLPIYVLYNFLDESGNIVKAEKVIHYESEFGPFAEITNFKYDKNAKLINKQLLQRKNGDDQYYLIEERQYSYITTSRVNTTEILITNHNYTKWGDAKSTYEKNYGKYKEILEYDRNGNKITYSKSKFNALNSTYSSMQHYNYAYKNKQLLREYRVNGISNYEYTYDKLNRRSQKKVFEHDFLYAYHENGRLYKITHQIDGQEFRQQVITFDAQDNWKSFLIIENGKPKPIREIKCTYYE